jgi:GT2 family glycosyltransferase
MHVSDAVVYHKGNATAGRLSDTHVYYHTRNLEFVWIKNMPTGLMLRFAHPQDYSGIGIVLLSLSVPPEGRAFFRAKRDALRMLPVMLKKRKQIQERRRVSNSCIRRLLTSVFSLAMFRQKFVQLVRG